MGRKTRTTLLHYGGAVAFTALAVLLRWLLDPWLDNSLPFPTLYGAVAFAVWLGGYRPALVATALGYLACDWLFAEPRGAFGFDSARNTLGLLLSLLSCGLIIGLGEGMRRARTRARASEFEAHGYGERLQKEITAHQTTEAALRAAKEDAERRAQEAEAALRSLAESERRYHTIGELIPYGVWMLDGQGEITHLNACFLEMLGPTIEEHKKAWTTRVHPDDYERIVGGLPRWLLAGQPWKEEFRIRGRDGEYRTLLSRGIPLRGEAGQIRSWVGINLDLTERKRAEEEAIRLNQELQRRADELQAVLDILPIGVAIAHDPQCRRITHNPYMSELLNVPAWANASLTAPEDERPTTFTNYRNGIEVPTSELPMQVACTGVEVRDLELDLVCRGRDPRTMLYHARPLFDERGHVRGGVGVCLDITARKQAEEALRREREQLRIVTDTMAAPVTRCSRDLKYLWVSKPYSDWINRPADEIIGRPILDIIGPEAFTHLRPRFEQVLSGQVVRYEEQVQFRGIGPRWINAVYTPTLDAAGVPDGWVAVILDITERRQMEEALGQSEQRFARFMHHLPGLAWIKDLQGRYVYANDAAVKAFRRTREGLYGRTDDEVVPPETAAQFKQNDRKALASEAGVQVVETLEQADGVVHHSVVSKFPILGPEGSPALVGGMAIDITDRLRAENVLAESEERFRQLAENINEVFWMTDPQTTQLHYISPAYERVWGRPCRSLYENPRSFLDAVHPDDRERVRIAVLEKQSRGEETDKEYRVVRPDGSVRWVRDRAFPVRNAAGQFYRLVGISDDVTERKHAEEALKEADRRKDEFLAILAHELRNPLAPIRTGLQVMRLAGNDRAAVERVRTMMERQVEHFVRLVDDLLDLSRISRGKIELHTERIELATVVNSAVELCDPLIKEAGHELTVTLPDGPVYVDADRTRLAQALCNLLTNAAKYSDRGGRIWLTGQRHGGELVVSVKDTGVGIPPDMLPRVFEMFTQVDRSLEKSQGGLGIGLSIVKRLIEMHGGDVQARSDGPGTGSEFIVRLPLLAAADVSESRPGEATQSPASLPLRILVVDDIEDVAESHAMLLRMSGHEVRIAHDGLEAVEAAAVFRPDLVLLDIGLPKLNGYDACRRIRELPCGGEMVLVAVTGWGQEEDLRKSTEAGFDHHMIKPVNYAAIQKLLQSLPVRK
jgi:PAS domain S-box-containing protein